MIVSVSGMGYVGAGAAYDLLCEYPEIEYKSNSFEFGILYEVDGVIDLVNKLELNNSKISSYIPIRRFLKLASFYSNFGWFSNYTNGFLYQEAEAFINNLGVIKSKGFQIPDYANMSDRESIILKWNTTLSRLLKRFGIKRGFPFSKTMYIYVGSDNLKLLASQFMQRVFDNLREEKGSVLLLKHLCPPNNPEICLPYFIEDLRHITLTRDPRDLYVLGKINKTSDFPCNSVDDFIRFYQKAFSFNFDNYPECIVIPFEDFCYKYEMTVNKIERFIGLNPITHRARTHFVPEESIHNTKLFEKYPEYAEDILKIETSLTSYLYPFE